MDFFKKPHYASKQTRQKYNIILHYQSKKNLFRTKLKGKMFQKLGTPLPTSSDGDPALRKESHPC